VWSVVAAAGAALLLALAACVRPPTRDAGTADPPVTVRPASGADAAARVPGSSPTSPAGSIVHDVDIAVPMRDGVVLRADVLRPPGGGPFPTLVYRTPYGKAAAVDDYTIFAKAVARGYAVVVQDVRGRYASAGEFLPYQQEGRDGYDTIEWAARQPWSNARVGTFGMSYPGAVQWLAAVESPPHLKAMVPAMTFATPRRFFYAAGVWDNSWAGWVWQNIAPDLRRRTGAPGPTTHEEADREWATAGDRILRQLPLAALPDFEAIAPWYYEWLRHEPSDPWWRWAELDGRYGRTDAAVLNLSGWHDEAYGPQGATANFTGLVEARAGKLPRTHLLIGPWPHGVGGMARPTVGERDVGDASRVDYDETVLRWMDRHVRGVDNGVDREPAVRVFVMGSNRWREADRWPLPGTRPDTLFLTGGPSGDDGALVAGTASLPAASLPAALRASSFVSDPANPVVDSFAARSGAHDYRALGLRPDVLTFETPPLAQDVEVVGAIGAEIYLSADARDTDLWVKVLDVAPDGTAFSLMYPGGDVVRASYRDEGGRRSLLEPGRIYLLRLPGLFTANRFARGHRIRVHVMTSFFPYFSRNLHTGALETTSDSMRSARITIHHDRRHPSRLILPVVAGEDAQATAGSR
jgi:putative CocE/NonD family hydrolase